MRKFTTATATTTKYTKFFEKIHSTDKRKSTTLHSPAGPMVTVEPSKTLTLLWGATGEQEWTPALTTGKNLVNKYTNLITKNNRVNRICNCFFSQLFTIL